MNDAVSLLPGNASAGERALEQATARVGAVPVPVGDLWDPDTCPVPLLGWLAWAMSVDDWDPNWSPDAKRAVIQASYDVHRRKGTPGAVKEALRAAGYGDSTLIERFGWGDANTPDDHWAEYRITITRPISAEQAATLRDILASIAPVRCRLAAIDFTEATHLYNDVITYDGAFTHGVV